MTIRILIALLAACGPGAIEARCDVNVDADHARLIGAVDAFVASGRTPTAFSELAATITRPAAEAELELVTLALAPLHAVQAKPIADQIELLALTVFPTLLAPSLTVSAERSELAPKRGEDAKRYLQRLCAGPLAASCKRAVPELQGQLVYALAIQRGRERAYEAVTRCVMCASDQGWHAATLAWEELDRGADESIHELERRADPDNWLVAAAAAANDPGLPEVDAATREMCSSHVIALHFRPDTTFAQARFALDSARKAGCSRIAIIAHEAMYPWSRRAYWVNDAKLGTMQPTDSLQMLLHAEDDADIL